MYLIHRADESIQGKLEEKVIDPSGNVVYRVQDQWFFSTDFYHYYHDLKRFI